MNAYRAWAEIDLDALGANLAVIRRTAGPGVRTMLVVKADAYGHGAVAIAHHAVRCGIGALGVGTSAEALELREAGVRLPILVLGTIVDEEAAATLLHRIEVGIHSSDRVDMLQVLARRLGLRARVHLNVDTGMGRLGVPPASAMRLLERIAGCTHLDLAGVMTHVSAPDGLLAPEAGEQVEAFERVLADARARGLLRGWIHAASSAAIFTGLGARFDTVRPGISAYGILPGGLPGADRLRPVMSFRSQVVFLKDVPAGTPIGYASTWRAPRATRIATIPVGYNDGVPWRLGNRGEVLVRGRRAPIVGRVSMDYTTIDVGALPGVEVGDRVTIFGADGDERIGAEDVAREVDTIPYEITCCVGKRVARVHVGAEDVCIPAQRHEPAPAAAPPLDAAPVRDAQLEPREGTAAP